MQNSIIDALQGAGSDAPVLNAADYAPAAAPISVDPMAAKIAQWKTQHREVHEIRVQVPGGEDAVCYICNPNRNILAYALTKTVSKQLLEAGEFILMNCWLGGDERCNPNSPGAFDPIVVAAAIEAANSIEILAANSKKL